MWVPELAAPTSTRKSSTLSALNIGALPNFSSEKIDSAAEKSLKNNALKSSGPWLGSNIAREMKKKKKKSVHDPRAESFRDNGTFSEQSDSVKSWPVCWRAPA